MSPIKVSGMVPEKVNFPPRIDPKQKSWVTVRPPGWREEKRRGELLSKRKYSYDDNRLVTEIDCNQRDLFEYEIWLTFGGTNLEVELENDEIVSFTDFVADAVREDGTEFIERLGKLPPFIVYAWRGLVIKVVERWIDPF